MTQSFSPLEGRKVPRFSGIRTFFRLPHHENAKDVDAMIVGIPYDGLSSYRPGSRFAPQALRETSSLGRLYHWEHQIEVFKKLKMSDGGDIYVNVFDAEETRDSIASRYAEILKHSCTPFAVGGDHSITLPILRAVHKHLGKPVCLIQFDAHADTYGPAWGVDVHHGTFVRHAIDEGLIDPERSLQVGLRGGVAAAADMKYSTEQGITVMQAHMIHTQPWKDTCDMIQEWKIACGSDPVYVTFDVDGLDPAFAPGTGTPVPGGLTTWQALGMLQRLVGINIAGGDVVEICPTFDTGGITSLAAMSVLFEMLALRAMRPQAPASR